MPTALFLAGEGLAFVKPTLGSRPMESVRAGLEDIASLRARRLPMPPGVGVEAEADLAFGRLPGVSGYTAYLAPPISRWGEDRASPVA